MELKITEARKFAKEIRKEMFGDKKPIILNIGELESLLFKTIIIASSETNKKIKAEFIYNNLKK